MSTQKLPKRTRNEIEVREWRSRSSAASDCDRAIPANKAQEWLDLVEKFKIHVGLLIRNHDENWNVKRGQADARARSVKRLEVLNREMRFFLGTCWGTQAIDPVKFRQMWRDKDGKADERSGMEGAAIQMGGEHNYGFDLHFGERKVASLRPSEHSGHREVPVGFSVNCYMGRIALHPNSGNDVTVELSDL